METTKNVVIDFGYEYGFGDERIGMRVVVVDWDTYQKLCVAAGDEMGSISGETQMAVAGVIKERR